VLAVEQDAAIVAGTRGETAETFYEWVLTAADAERVRIVC
jgi:hypothetical protein